MLIDRAFWTRFAFTMSCMSFIIWEITWYYVPLSKFSKIWMHIVDIATLLGSYHNVITYTLNIKRMCISPPSIVTQETPPPWSCWHTSYVQCKVMYYKGGVSKYCHLIGNKDVNWVNNCHFSHWSKMNNHVAMPSSKSGWNGQLFS